MELLYYLRFPTRNLDHKEGGSASRAALRGAGNRTYRRHRVCCERLRCGQGFSLPFLNPTQM